MDYNDGLNDLKNKIIRIKEDSSRILRAVYLAAKLEFKIDDELCKAIMKSNIEMPSELIGKILKKVKNFKLFLNLLKKLQLTKIIIIILE